MWKIIRKFNLLYIPIDDTYSIVRLVTSSSFWFFIFNVNLGRGASYYNFSVKLCIGQLYREFYTEIKNFKYYTITIVQLLL